MVRLTQLVKGWPTKIRTPFSVQSSPYIRFSIPSEMIYGDTPVFQMELPNRMNNTPRLINRYNLVLPSSAQIPGPFWTVLRFVRCTSPWSVSTRDK
ncbi:hypothetical protein D3C76_1199050 [compost metagenome]